MTNEIAKQAQNNSSEIQVMTKAINDYLINVKTKSGAKPTETDVSNFINTCIAQKLNPFKKQAYLTGYDSKGGATFTTIIGIDGYRAIAHRTGLYAGGSMKEVEMRHIGGRIPESVTFAVKKLVNGTPCEFEATVYYDEAVQTSYSGEANAMWSKRPKGQLIKCAEANALRMAFPDELGGMYTDAEIDPEPAQKPELDSFLAQNIERKFADLATLTNKTTEFISDFWLNTFNVARVLDLSESQAKNLNKKLEKEIQSRQPQPPAQEVVDVQTVQTVGQKPDLVTEAQLKRLFAMWGEAKALDPAFDVEFQKTYITENYNVDSTKELTKTQYAEISSSYEELLDGLKSKANQAGLPISGTNPVTQI